LLQPQPENCRRIRLEHPILTDRQLEALRHIHKDGFKAVTLPILYNPHNNGEGLEAALETMFAVADAAIEDGVDLLILSDRHVDRHRAGIPALLATAGLHHHLIRQGTRTQVSLIVESGEPREVHHFAVLLGYGADAINPYLALATIDHVIQKEHLAEITPAEAEGKYIKAVVTGVVKILSKMGISTIQSYRGAQIFEALGLHKDVVERYFTGTSSRIQGSDLGMIAREVVMRHVAAFPERPSNGHTLPAGGKYQWREEGSSTSSTRKRCTSCSTPSATTITPRTKSTPTTSMNAPNSTLPCAACSKSAPRRRRCRWTRSNRSIPSAAASKRARCPTARSARKRTSRWRWR
jgi:glutamate synthase domain-containing protein 2